MLISIRNAKTEDASSIADIELNSGYPHQKDFDALKRTEFILKNRSILVFIAIVNKELVGYRAIELKGNLADSGYLSVRKNFQGKGVGKKLLTYSINAALNNNCNLMRVYVRDSNKAAKKLYENFGFKTVKSFNHNNKIKHEMIKRLR